MWTGHSAPYCSEEKQPAVVCNCGSGAWTSWRLGGYFFPWTSLPIGASLIAQLVKNPPAMQETQMDSWVRKILWRRDRLPTPVFLGFPCGSAGEESACNAGDLGSIPGLPRSRRRERLPTPVFWPGEFHGLYSPRGCKESDTTFGFTWCPRDAQQISALLIDWRSFSYF